ncbi:MAG: hypothetical protein OXG71_09360 [Rhodospirillales bacterium]|nr:hypothetical protein [Rhodospirillales bacterium]
MAADAYGAMDLAGPGDAGPQSRPLGEEDIQMVANRSAAMFGQALDGDGSGCAFEREAGCADHVGDSDEVAV